LSGDWMNDALIAFTFEDKSQDVDRFRNEPFCESVLDKLAENAAFPVDGLL